MRISEYAIKNNQFTLIMVLMVVAVGIATLLGMPRAEDPEFSAPIFPIVVVYPGASPEDMEELVVDPIEKEVYGLSNIKRVKSTIKDGLAVVVVEYKYASNVDDKYQELIRETSALRSKLPKDIYSMEVHKSDASNVNILQMALISENASKNQLLKAADNLQKKLERITQLKNVEIQGITERVVRVDLQLDKLAQLKIPVPFVTNALQSEMSNIPGGNITEGTKSFNLKTNSNFKHIDEIKNTLIASHNNGSVLLKDIADIYYDFSQESHITRLNGHRCVFVVAALKQGENISQVQELYLPEIETFRKTLPSNIDLNVHFDQADNVNKRLSSLGIDFAIAIGLVLITLLPLGSRASLVVMIAIPLSLGIGIVIMNLLGYSLNQLSIVGLVVALGLLVDDSIVVVENIERWMREGHSRLEATIKGVKQISNAVLGCTITLIIAFMPLAFMPEAAGDFIRSLPIAVMGTIFGSMIVALTIVPFLSSRILKPSKDEHGNIFLKALQKLIHGTYARLLDAALKKPLLTLVIAAIIFAGSLALIPVVGSSLFPASEKPQFLINIQTPLQSNIQHTDTVTKAIEKELATLKLIEHYAANVGKGNPAVYYNVTQANEQTDFAQIFVQLKSETKPNQKTALIKQLRNKWTPYPGAEIKVLDFEQGQPQLAPVEIRLIGENLDTLTTLAANVENLLLKTEGAIYVNNPLKHLKSDIRVNVNKNKAQSLGVPVVNIGQTVRMALSGIPIGTYTDANRNDNEYKIMLSSSRSSFPDINIFSRIYINANDGRAIPLLQLANIGLETSPQTINHLNKNRTVSITAFVQEGYLNADVINSTIAAMDKMQLPSGFSYEMGGEVQSRQESFQGFGTIIMITVFMFIAVLVLQFRTFKSTLIVLSVIPLGIVGAVLALLITGNTLSFVATVGIVALAGIEVKNTILLVDFTNQLRAQGMELNKAIEEAGEKRFLPIILTTLTAIGGLIPIAISSNPLIAPLAIVMIGGLISSTLLSRVVTPVIYKLLPPKIDKTDEVA